MTDAEITAIALAAVVIVVLAEHLAIWSLFFKRGWKVSVPPAPKTTAIDAAVPAAGEGPAGTADQTQQIRTAA